MEATARTVDTFRTVMRDIGLERQFGLTEADYRKVNFTRAQGRIFSSSGKDEEGIDQRLAAGRTEGKYGIPNYRWPFFDQFGNHDYMEMIEGVCELMIQHLREYNGP